VLDPVIVAWGYPLSHLELLAFGLALACVVLEVLEIHWAWPLALASSLLYGWLFQIHRLYGEAGLQLFFAAMAIWGWTQWLHGRRGGTLPALEDPAGLRIVRLGARRWPLLLAGWLAGWGLLGYGLARFTDSDVPWFDAFPTAGSVLGTLLMGRKFVEAWPVWLGVNFAGTALFAYKALYLTAILYAIFCVLAAIGWRRWLARAGSIMNRAARA